jgi:transposase
MRRTGVAGAARAGRAVAVGVVARKVFDLPPLRLVVAEHRPSDVGACRTSTQAVFPVEARAAACYGPGVRALCCYLLVYQHLPVDRAARLLDDVLGLPVSTGRWRRCGRGRSRAGGVPPGGARAVGRRGGALR